MTRDLFNLIIEIHPSMTSGGLAEHVKHEYSASSVALSDLLDILLTELHLLEYQQAMLEYLQEFQKKKTAIFQSVELTEFSSPQDPLAYNDKSITDDMVMDILLKYTKRTCKAESTNYLQTLSGEQAVKNREGNILMLSF